ncbi:Transporter [Candidatus Rhodobacter oscarellae]|uniref:Transporter n=1 Tax=Candidatus Rhodobacter oscarellae TaxID=1675527 RepID=A0A0J9E455_9RHOB|nr:permease [Candidatus Rhodobacter lobularis]KMW57596.1 Transporter [Candidatus Rhodobacter lobularis]
MADLTQRAPGGPSLWKRLDKAWLAVAVIPLIVLVLDAAMFLPVVRTALGAFAGTAPIILFAISAVAYVKASGAETLIAKAFEGDVRVMIVLAALMGGLSPFCPCEVIPFIAALLAVGAPLAAVMAFWLASPLMDPAMFLITAGELGLAFALGKTVAAVALGLFGGFATMAFARSAVFADPLKEKPAVGGCCGVKKPFQGKPVWRFWTEAERRVAFRDSWVENALFLVKWLMIAYLFEAIMVEYETTQFVAQFLSGEGVFTILMAALIGMPAYLNGYMAVGLMGGLVEQGMAQGAAMAFVLAGGVSCIPAAVAVWALVKPRVFAAYLGFAFIGAVLAGLAWNLVA